MSDLPRGGWRYGLRSVRHDAVVDQVRQGLHENPILVWHGDNYSALLCETLP